MDHKIHHIGLKLLVIFLVVFGCTAPHPSVPAYDIQDRAHKAFDQMETDRGKLPTLPQPNTGRDEETSKRADKAFKDMDRLSENHGNGKKPGGGSSADIAEDPDVKVLQKDPGGCTWVDAQASTSFGENDTKYQAKAQAVSEARAKAMDRFLGVNLQHQFIDFQQEGLKGQVSLTESLLRVTQLGRVLKEKILSSGPQDMPDCPGCRFFAHIQTCIMPQPDKSDTGFRVTLSLNRTTFKEGDEALIEVTSNRDAYLYIYNVDMAGNAALMLPNDYAKENRIAASQKLIFPDEETRRKGIRVVAQMPDTMTVSAEMIRVIASKSPLPPSLTDTTAPDFTQKGANSSKEIHGTGSFLGLMSKLNANPIEWVEDAQAFTIYQK